MGSNVRVATRAGIVVAVVALLAALAPGVAAHGRKCETSPGVTHRQERIIGTAAADFINCASAQGDHRIEGLGANDVIWAGSGNDVILGGDGNDQIRSGAGNDTVWGGNGDDQIGGDAGADTLTGDLGLDSVLGGDGDDSVATGDPGAGGGQEGASGDDGNDTVTGGSGDDELDGGAGNDTINGNAGNDFIVPGPGNDVVGGGGNTIRDTVWALGATGPVTASTSTATNDGFGGSDTYTGVEALRGGDFDDFLTGDASGNELDGSGGNDILVGGGGLDVLIGATGNDTLNGQAGNDILNGGDGDDGMAGEAGIDQFVGGDGSDTVLALTASQRFVSDVDGAREDGYGAVGNYAETYTGVENLTGGSFDDILTGGPGPNSLTGGNGNDTISGLGGDDILVGNPGDDTLDGGPDTDSCFGDAGNDTITNCEAVNDPVEGPDLTVVSVSLGVPIGTPQANTANPWTARIANLGTQAANVYLIHVTGAYSANTTFGDGDDVSACGRAISDIQGTTLGPGASMDVYVGCGAARSGAYLVAKVDSTSELAEGDETNNVAFVALTP